MAIDKEQLAICADKVVEYALERNAKKEAILERDLPQKLGIPEEYILHIRNKLKNRDYINIASKGSDGLVYYIQSPAYDHESFHQEYLRGQSTTKGNTINVEGGMHGSVIVQDSLLDKPSLTPINKPTTIPTAAATNTKTNSWFKIAIAWVLKNIILVIALALLVAYLVYYFGWN